MSSDPVAATHAEEHDGNAYGSTPCSRVEMMREVKFTVEFTVNTCLAPDVYPPDLETEEERIALAKENINENWEHLDDLIDSADAYEVTAVEIMGEARL